MEARRFLDCFRNLPMVLARTRRWLASRAAASAWSACAGQPLLYREHPIVHREVGRAQRYADSNAQNQRHVVAREVLRGRMRVQGVAVRVSVSHVGEDMCVDPRWCVCGRVC